MPCHSFFFWQKENCHVAIKDMIKKIFFIYFMNPALLLLLNFRCVALLYVLIATQQPTRSLKAIRFLNSPLRRRGRTLKKYQLSNHFYEVSFTEIFFKELQ